jgi:excinuclease ABC subunit A
MIIIRGARQNNLRNLDLDLPTNELIVVTGVSGSGKSSLVFDSLYAEGQRRYVETFSTYARQFLDRMDKPQVDRIEGIPPAIAIDQTNPVRNSRSTVGTMTELNDHLKLLYARAAHLFCGQCQRSVRRDSAQSIVAEIGARSTAADLESARLLVTFPVPMPEAFSEEEVLGLLARQGYTRIHARHAGTSAAPAKRRGKKQPLRIRTVLEMIQDRLRFDPNEPARLVEALEAALRVGRGRLSIYPQAAQDADRGGGTVDTAWRFSSDLHCAECDLHFQEAVPSLFSFNSPLGACESCRGFGRIIGIDFGLIVPDTGKSLREGAVKPWQSESYSECQDDLIKFAKLRGVPIDVPWRALSEAQREWVLEGEGDWRKKVWYGVRRFFAWLETKSYKMHIRVLLSKYRAYTECSACQGARLKPQSLLWRIGPAPGLNIREMMLLPIHRLHAFFDELRLPAPLDEAADLLLREVRSRLRFLLDVGLGYLTLDRQSRTLSGGEVQRINLTTALGTSLVNSLFVLDEPSIGLHPRDMTRVIEVMQRLRAAGNSLVVVEHDPQVMLAADRILDIGPGPGARGGQIVFYGPPAELANAAQSLTADYLTGRKRVHAVEPGSVNRSAAGAGQSAATTELVLRTVRANNLRSIDVHIPLQQLVCVTGVSGSGKSTLVQDVLYPALLKHFGKPTVAPGEHGGLAGAERLREVVMVDQAPIGRTTRSNPASYVGAFDCIRRLFATQPLARERAYTLGTFSFNSGTGRCPTCSGNGFEHIEMQFLSDVYLRCPDCDGKRYRAEILEVKLTGGDGTARSVAEVLDMTVSEAVDCFAAHAEVVRALQPLIEVGLDYVKLGQPVPTLSGGEAQRLKLAGYLVGASDAAPEDSTAGHILFLFDEPTTGLHFDDIAKLLRALRRLLTSGHSLLVIEHNLDVIAASDWIIDLGPEGGEAGGAIVCAGAPHAIMGCAASHTGVALAQYREQFASATNPWLAEQPAAPPATQPGAGRPRPALSIHGAREHNLKNIDVVLPREQFNVITGVSGSGKSTLAFDIVFGEGQRRYLESINAYARQFIQPPARPDVDAIFGIPPTVAIEQRTSRGGLKSTVATATEIYHFLRLMFVKLGTQHCPSCEVPIEPQSLQSLLARLLRDYRRRHITLLAPLVVARKGYYTDLAKWAAKKGFTHLRVDGQWTGVDKWPRLDRFKEHTLELPVATLQVDPAGEVELQRALLSALEFGKGVVGVIEDAPENSRSERRAAKPVTEPQVQLFSTRRACPQCGTSFAELDPRLFSFNSKHGWCQSCFGTGLQLQGFEAEHSGEENAWSGAVPQPCTECAGERLNPIARHVRFQGQSIAELTSNSVTQLRAVLAKLKLTGRAAQLARDVLAEVSSRLGFLEEVGLGYLALNRAAPTLSGGEAQRIRLAAQLGSTLQGVCYVLDEPTIGLHPRDNQVLLSTLERLAKKGNSLLVVEHDEDTIRRADHVVDLGPGAGSRGGFVVAAGTAAELAASPQSVTGRFLAAPLRHPLYPRRSVAARGSALTIRDAQLHNLQRVTVRVPLERLVVVTGVSGSGKSTLAREVLHDNLRAVLTEQRARTAPSWHGCRDIAGWQALSRILEVDQTPIGKTPRSCPATYVGFWDAIRALFAATTEARMRGFDASRFSFNTGDGRCAGCEGQGLRRIEMSFLPDVSVACDVCRGQRFNPETLAVQYRGKSIGEVLLLSVDAAVEFFTAHARIHHALQLLQDVGLGYLTLGQQSPTLSGGEAQRIKLVTELAKVAGAGRREARSSSATLYVLDEPTVGLHMADVEKLLRVLHRLVDAGNSVVVIEHNLDVMAEADWIIDLGPEGGAGGGRVVAEGTPEQMGAQARRSHTARVLKEFLQERSSGIEQPRGGRSERSHGSPLGERRVPEE